MSGKFSRFASFALLFALGASTAAQAHHSRVAFDLNRKVEMKVHITQVRWANPHVFLVGTIVNAQGQKEEWTFEGHSISGLVRQGWSKETVHQGDDLTLVVNPHHDASKRFALMDNVVLASGKRMYSVGQPSPNEAPVRPPVVASKDFSGNWRFQFPGTPEEVRKRVLLGTPPPSADGPYTAKARAQVARYNENDDPTLRCIPSTMPYLIMTVYEYKWKRYDDRIVIEKEQYNESTRTIWLNGAKRSAGFKANPLGFSTGHFEPDGTLVVDTSGFNAAPWGNGTGIDSSEKKHIVERYKLIDGGMRMSVDYTLDDPEFFTQTRNGRGTFAKTPDADFAVNPPCDLKAAQQHLQYDR